MTPTQAMYGQGGVIAALEGSDCTVQSTCGARCQTLPNEPPTPTSSAEFTKGRVT
jgi:hypothetical protein